MRSLIAIVVVVGFFVGFGSGLVEIESGYFGFPLAWRVVDLVTGEKSVLWLELFVDCLFGMLMVGMVAVAAALTEKYMVKKEKPKKRK